MKPPIVGDVVSTPMWSQAYTIREAAKDAPMDEILDLFRRAAAVPKCLTTALALYNRAHDLMDDVAWNPASKEGAFVHKYRRSIRDLIPKNLSTRERIQAGAKLWIDAFASGWSK